MTVLQEQVCVIPMKTYKLPTIIIIDTLTSTAFQACLLKLLSYSQFGCPHNEHAKSIEFRTGVSTQLYQPVSWTGTLSNDTACLSGRHTAQFNEKLPKQ